MIKQTLGIILEENYITLGMKKRSFGADWWNGLGGKNKDGESDESCLKREGLEEAGIKITEAEQMGQILFHFPDKEISCAIYAVRRFSGNLSETEEMGNWTKFPFDTIPYDKMWPADRYWLPLFVAGKRFAGDVWFNEAKQISQEPKINLVEPSYNFAANK